MRDSQGGRSRSDSPPRTQRIRRKWATHCARVSERRVALAFSQCFVHSRGCHWLLVSQCLCRSISRDQQNECDGLRKTTRRQYGFGADKQVGRLKSASSNHQAPHVPCQLRHRRCLLNHVGRAPRNFFSLNDDMSGGTFTSVAMEVFFSVGFVEISLGSTG